LWRCAGLEVEGDGLAQHELAGRGGALTVDEDRHAATARFTERAPGVDTERVQHREHVAGHPRVRERVCRRRGTRRSMPEEIDADRTKPVAHAPRQRIEEPRTEPGGVQEHQWLPVAAPVEPGDPQPVVLDDHPRRRCSSSHQGASLTRPSDG
jgi:hypothetical protein